MRQVLLKLINTFVRNMGTGEVKVVQFRQTFEMFQPGVRDVVGELKLQPVELLKASDIT